MYPTRLGPLLTIVTLLISDHYISYILYHVAQHNIMKVKIAKSPIWKYWSNWASIKNYFNKFCDLSIDLKTCSKRIYMCLARQGLSGTIYDVEQWASVADDGPILIQLLLWHSGVQEVKGGCLGVTWRFVSIAVLSGGVWGSVRLVASACMNNLYADVINPLLC